MAKNVGYAKRSLIDKLGLKSGHRACFHGAPDDYESTLGVLPEEVTVVRQLRGEFDFIQFFTDRRAVLGKRLPALKKALKKDGMLWVSWPKKASGVPTDVTEDVVRETGVPPVQWSVNRLRRRVPSGRHVRSSWGTGS